jgi:porphobilinogen synthase
VNLPLFPANRPRRLRRDAFSRAMVREHRLSPADFILPVFVHDIPGRAPIPPCRAWSACPSTSC